MLTEYIIKHISNIIFDIDFGIKIIYSKTKKQLCNNQSPPEYE